LDKTRELGKIITDILAVKLGVFILISRFAILYSDLIRSITSISTRSVSTKISWAQVAESYGGNTQTSTRGSARSTGTNIRKQGGVARVPIKEKPVDPRIIISIRAEARLNKPEAYVLRLALYKNIKDLIIKRIPKIQAT
jgi:hypothetical protein